jgi:hypothetical protein
MDRVENDTSSDSSVAACVFVAMVMFLASRFPSDDRGILTEPLLSNSRGLHIQTDGRDL